MPAGGSDVGFQGPHRPPWPWLIAVPPIHPAAPDSFPEPPSRPIADPADRAGGRLRRGHVRLPPYIRGDHEPRELYLRVPRTRVRAFRRAGELPHGHPRPRHPYRGHKYDYLHDRIDSSAVQYRPRTGRVLQPAVPVERLPQEPAPGPLAHPAGGQRHHLFSVICREWLREPYPFDPSLSQSPGLLAGRPGIGYGGYNHREHLGGHTIQCGTSVFRVARRPGRTH